MDNTDQIKQQEYDEEYYENGIVSKKSCYLNYHWLPELTFRMAFHIVRELNIPQDAKVLDFGCAKGYMVKALRFFDIEGYGCDISEYAIKNLDGEVRDYCKKNCVEKLIPFDDLHFDWILCKDVMEHLSEEELCNFLQQARQKSTQMFVVVPLGDGNKFVVPEYELDATHKLRKDVEWWQKKFEDNNWSVESVKYNFRRLKDNWTNKYPKSNAFFVLRNKS